MDLRTYLLDYSTGESCITSCLLLKNKVLWYSHMLITQNLPVSFVNYHLCNLWVVFIVNWNIPITCCSTVRVWTSCKESTCGRYKLNWSLLSCSPLLRVLRACAQPFRKCKHFSVDDPLMTLFTLISTLHHLHISKNHLKTLAIVESCILLCKCRKTHFPYILACERQR